MIEFILYFLQFFGAISLTFLIVFAIKNKNEIRRAVQERQDADDDYMRH